MTKTKKIVKVAIIICTIGGACFIANNTFAYEETVVPVSMNESSETSDSAIEENIEVVNSDDSTVSPVKPEMLNTTNEKMVEIMPISAVVPVTKISNISYIEGEYIGSGYIMSNNKKIKVVSKKLQNVKKGDIVHLGIKGNINNFSIHTVKVNGEEIMPAKVTMTSVVPKEYNSGIFTISGLYESGVLHTAKSKIKLAIKDSAKYEGKEILVQVKGTIKSFKVLKVSEMSSALDAIESEMNSPK